MHFIFLAKNRVLLMEAVSVLHWKFLLINILMTHKFPGHQYNPDESMPCWHSPKPDSALSPSTQLWLAEKLAGLSERRQTKVWIESLVSGLLSVRVQQEMRTKNSPWHRFYDCEHSSTIKYYWTSGVWPSFVGAWTGQTSLWCPQQWYQRLKRGVFF